MEDIENTLGNVCRLIERIAGCSVLRAGVETEHAVIDLVGMHVTLMALQDVFASANADIAPWLHACDRPADEAATQTFRASVARRDGKIAHGNLQLAGIHLVWRLNRDGLIGADEANSYLLRWGAAPVGT